MRYLFFQAAANDAAAYPVSALRGIDTANGAIHLYFTPQRITDVATAVERLKSSFRAFGCSIHSLIPSAKSPP